MPTVGLVDADIVVYQIASAVECPIDWGDGEWTLHADLKEACQTADVWINKIKRDLDLDEIILAFSDTKNNFRKQIYPEYKSHRKNQRKPVVFKPLREHLQSQYISYERPSLEGDDILGILATGQHIPAVKKFNRRIIISIDKDLKTVPGFFYNLSKPEQGVVEITEEEADYYHMFQTLVGDISDGYSGCPGIGPKKAAKCLEGSQGVADMWNRVVCVYEKHGLTEKDALVQARLSRILRVSDYDFKKKEPILWNPNL